MVKSQPGKILKWVGTIKRLYGPPSCFNRIAATLYRATFQQRIKHHRDHTFARVTIYSRIDAKLSDMGTLYTRFFLQFTFSTLFYYLIYLHETTRQCPVSLIGIFSSFHKQNLQLLCFLQLLVFVLTLSFV